MLASNAVPIALMLIFFLGAICMRSAGCIINDLADRDFDAQVERTRTRPLACGAISTGEATTVLLILLSIACAILLTLPPLAIAIGGLSIIPVTLYPFMKRWTYWPQLFLGITFNLGILIAWVTIKQNITLTPILLYFAGLLWTLGYDTVYGHQDKKDDLMIGVKSLSIRMDKHTRVFVAMCYTLMLILLLTVGINMHLSAIYYGSIAVASLILLWQIITLDINNPTHCLKLFKSNAWVGAIICAGIFLEVLLAVNA